MLQQKLTSRVRIIEPLLQSKKTYNRLSPSRRCDSLYPLTICRWRPSFVDRLTSRATPKAEPSTRHGRERMWGDWWQIPIPATPNRPTVRAELVKDQIFGFDQIQGTLKIYVNTRMTVVVLQEGLLVNNPVAPTKECLRLLNELVQKYGEVKFITLSSVALEHKVGEFKSCIGVSCHSSVRQTSSTRQMGNRPSLPSQSGKSSYPSLHSRETPPCFQLAWTVYRQS